MSVGWRAFSKSPSLRPRDVMAGMPMRTPPGVSAETSPATEFMLSVMCAASHAACILLPVMPWSRRSQSSRWFSLPPVAMV